MQRETQIVKHSVFGSRLPSRGNLLQRRASGPGPDEVPPIAQEGLRSQGQPLDPTTRAFTNPLIGHDFSRICVHSSEPDIQLRSRPDSLRGLFAKSDAAAVTRAGPHLSEENEASESPRREDTPGLQAVPTSVAEDGVPSTELKSDEWGLTWPEKVKETITAAKSVAKWRTKVTDLKGHYSKQTRLLPGVQEVTGPAGNTNSQNFCAQAVDLATGGNNPGAAWFMLGAVIAHEDVHATRMLPGLEAAAPDIQADFNSVSVPDAPDKTAESAAAEFTAQPRSAKARANMVELWRDEAALLVKGDHRRKGPTQQAEERVVNPMIATICEFSRKENWSPCKDVCKP